MDGWDPTSGGSCDVENGGPCVIKFGAGTLNVTSMVLFSQGISFFIQSLLLPTIGKSISQLVVDKPDIPIDLPILHRFIGGLWQPWPQDFVVDHLD